MIRIILSIISLIIGTCFSVLPTVITLENTKAIKEIIPYLDFETLRIWGIILIIAGGFSLFKKITK